MFLYSQILNKTGRISPHQHYCATEFPLKFLKNQQHNEKHACICVQHTIHPTQILAHTPIFIDVDPALDVVNKKNCFLTKFKVYWHY